MKITSRSQLVELIRKFQMPLTIVEVGVAEGIFSTELLSLGAEKLYLVDIWERVPFIEGCASFDKEWHDKNYKDIVEKFGNNPKVILLKGFSYKMAEQIPDNSVSLVYVDGDHTRQGVSADIEAYYPKLIREGIMAFHDYNDSYGVMIAVKQFAQKNNLQIFEIPEDDNPDNRGAYFIKR